MTAMVIQSNKIVQKKLKTTKHYYSHDIKKKKRMNFFWPTHIFYNRNQVSVFLESNQPLTVK